MNINRDHKILKYTLSIFAS